MISSRSSWFPPGLCVVLVVALTAFTYSQNLLLLGLYSGLPRKVALGTNTTLSQSALETNTALPQSNKMLHSQNMMVNKTRCDESLGTLEHIKFLDDAEGDRDQQCHGMSPEKPKLAYNSWMCQHPNSTNFIHIDLGARDPGLDSSVQWFLRNYQQPSERKFKIHAFEADPRFKSKWVEEMPDVDYNEVIVGTEDTKVDFIVGQDGMGRMIVNPDGGKFQAIDFDRWIRQHVKETDFVTVKMDIEGVEHALIGKMIATGSIKLVDEIFIECHYNRYNCASPGRTKKWNTTWDSCKNLFGDLRSRGVWAHSWG